MPMTSKERVVRTLNFEEVDRVPRQLWALPGIGQDRADELKAFRDCFAKDDILGARAIFAKGDRAKGDYSRRGRYTDDWGCVWEVFEDGIIGEIKDPILADDDAVASYVPPFEVLEGADVAPVAQQRKECPDEYILASNIGIFERMQFLRGTEQLFIDLALRDPIAFRLRDMIHEYNLEAAKILASCDADGVSLFDDWGTQRSLLIDPQLWRSFFRPCYAQYCDIIRRSGKDVFFHSDGFIESIYPDFIDIGVNAINSQLFCMDMEKLGREYAGKIAFWGEIDRQFLMPFGTEQQVREGVRRAAAALMPHGKRTGVFAQCEWGIADPLENVLAVFDEWEKI